MNLKILKSFLFEKRFIIALLLIILLGSLLYFSASDYHGFLSDNGIDGYMATGDHGRDLYAAYAITQGHTPYRDFWWIYGPLMPYYYALSFMILGVSVKSIMIAKSILIILSGVFIFLTLAKAGSVSVAFLGALWFFAFKGDFTYTYNHTGGVTLLLALLFLMVSYIKDGKLKYLYWALGVVVLLCFVKLNFGAGALGAMLVSVVCCDLIKKENLFKKKKLFYALAFIGVPLAVFLIYFAFVHGIPSYRLRQYFPYFNQDQFKFTSKGENLLALLHLPFGWIKDGKFYFLMLLFFLAGGVTAVYATVKDRKNKNNAFFMWTCFLVTGVFLVLNMHEFIMTGIDYRLHWGLPTFFVFLFLLLIPVATRWPSKIWGVVFVVMLVFISQRVINQLEHLRQIRNDDQLLTISNERFYVRNKAPWIDTVTKTTNYLHNHVKEGETFWAIPYDPLYYFLEKQLSPTDQLQYFSYLNISEQQEDDIIAQLEANNTNWVVLSSRFRSTEQGLGKMGVNYCPKLGAYLTKHFRVAAEYGDWQSFPGAVKNHGTRVLTRR